MKNSFKYILIGLSLLAVSLTATAQTTVPPGYSEQGGVATAKRVCAQNEDGTYTITLETFATGKEEVVITTAPADIVLVLDLSQSMTANYGGTTREYTARPSQGYSYNGYGNNTSYYYLHTDGEYYRVQRQSQGNRPTYYRLRYQVGNQWYYLSGTSTTTTAPTNVTSNSTTIWTGVLYTMTESQGTRLSALQSAVTNFLEVIYHNDNYEDDTDAHPRSEPLGNRLSVVTFGGPQGNTTVTRVNTGLTNVTNSDGSKNTAIISDLLSLTTGQSTTNGINNSAHYGTYSDEGMVLANGVLAGIDSNRKENSTRTVVLFTDGEPGRGSGWTNGEQNQFGTYYPEETDSPHTADRCIQASYISKNTHDASVFTVVLYSGTISNDMRNYLEWTSSDYPQAPDWYSTDHGTKESDSYALEAGNDIQGVFKTIAHASGGASATVGAQTQVRDVVSSSFKLPIDTSTMSDEQINAWIAENIHVYTSAIADDGNSWGTPVAFNAATITVNSSTNMVSVEGFDYSADENWVGRRYDESYPGDHWKWSGKKLIIEFNIVADGQSTGGVGTATNTAESGVYLYDPDTNTYTCINHYEIPHTLLPVNIRIRKTGLRSGESATFEIQKCRPKGWNNNGATLADKMANVEYNALGKPKPSASDDGTGWETFSKVILTNKSATNGTAVEKTILCLDPYWVYKVKEDDWGWSYVTTGEGGVQTTSTVEVNPFKFVNVEKTGVPKHGEAVAVNHFAETADGEAHTESYKSSKD